MHCLLNLRNHFLFIGHVVGPSMLPLCINEQHRWVIVMLTYISGILSYFAFQ